MLTSASATASNVTITYTKAVSTTEEGTLFYIHVPAQTYRNFIVRIN